MRNAKRWAWITISVGLLGFSGVGRAGADGDALKAPRRVVLDDIKVQWYSNGEEELPAWISARFQVGPLGGVTGRVTETDLSSDGQDDDGDPEGFETEVFDTSDGSLRSVALDARTCTFTTVFADKNSGKAVYALHRSGRAAHGWMLSVAQVGADGDAYGRNRFGLSASTDRRGVLTITTAPVADDGTGAGAGSL